MKNNHDILWWNSSDGQIQIWFMDGHKIVHRNNVVDEHGLQIPIGPPWSIVAAGDFDGNGKSDILWWNSSDGQIQIWFMDGHKIVHRNNVVDEHGQQIPIGPPWSIVAAGDFDGTGKSDILWWNSSDGQIQIWFMDGHKIVHRNNVVDEHGQQIPIGPPWSIVAAGDFDGNGKSDILWWNSSDGQIQIWFMDGHKIVHRNNVVDEHGQQIPIGPPWSIVAAGDFDGNGKSDILWWNSSDGQIQIWFMDGHKIVHRNNVVDEHGQQIPIGPPWNIVAAGDFDSSPAPHPVQVDARMQFRLRGFAEHASTDNFLQGGSDEVFLSAIGTDSAAVVVGPDHQPTLELKHSGVVGDVSEDRVRNPWMQTPHVLLDFDLRGPSDWPRSLSVTLLIVEEDNQKVSEAFAELHSEVGGVVKQAAVKAASTAAGALVGAAIGSVIPGIGTAVGAAVGGLAGAAYDEIIKAITEGLANEVFTPVTLTLLLPDPAGLAQHPQIDARQTVDIAEHGAKYAIDYDWHLV